MADKYVVAWGEKDGKQGVPVDDDYYANSVEEAKEASRKLLEKSAGGRLIPVAIIKLTEEEIEEMLTSNREMIELFPDEDFVILDR